VLLLDARGNAVFTLVKADCTAVLMESINCWNIILFNDSYLHSVLEELV